MTYGVEIPLEEHEKDGAHQLHDRRLAIHLMVQPPVAHELLSDPLAIDTSLHVSLYPNQKAPLVRGYLRIYFDRMYCRVSKPADASFKGT